MTIVPAAIIALMKDFELMLAPGRKA